MAAVFDRRDHLKITRNAVKCLACNKTIYSEDRHDCRVCGCPNQAMVDGGLDYVRCGAADMSKIEILTEYTMPNCLCGHTWDDHHHGCVMNPDYYDSPMTFQGLMAQECEATQTNGDWHSEDPADHCHCSNYEPNDFDLIKASKAFDMHRMLKHEEELYGNGEQQEVGTPDKGTEEDSRTGTDAQGAGGRDAGSSTEEDFVDIKDW